MHGHAISAHDLAPSSRTKKNSAHHFLMARNIFGPEATQNLQHLYISHEHASTCIIMRMHHDNTLVPSATFIIMMHHTFTVKNDVYYYDALDPGTTCNFYYYYDAFSCKGSRPLGATFSKRQLGRGGARLPLGLEPPIPGAAHQASCGRRTARSWRGATHAPERAELADEGRSSAADEALVRSDPT